MSEQIFQGTESHAPAAADAVLSACYDTLRPTVRVYATHVRSQILRMFEEYGAQDYQSFKQLVQADPRHISQKTIDQLHTLLKELQKTIQTNDRPVSNLAFTISHAANPYFEVLNNNNSTAPGSERFVELEVDLADILEDDRKRYQDAGLSSWAKNLPQSVDELNLSAEHRAAVAVELQLGAIPIFMPSDRVQSPSYEQTVQAVTSLRPIEIRNRRKQYVSGAAFNPSDILLRSPNDIMSSRQFPKDAYLVLIKPTLSPDRATMGISLQSQQRLLEMYMDDYSFMAELSPMEYVVAQHIFTHRVSEFAKAIHAEIEILTPLDISTSTRFVTRELPTATSRESSILKANWRWNWNNTQNQIRFEEVAVGQPSDDSGFRTVVRIPLVSR